MPTNVLVLNKSWLITGAGAPEGSLAGPLGSIYLREDGQAGQTMYVKEAGAAGNTGWRAFATADSVTLPANVALKDQANVFTQNQTINGNLLLTSAAPEIQWQAGGAIQKTHLATISPSSGPHLSSNLYFNAGWFRDDITLGGSIFAMNPGSMGWYVAAAGANPANLLGVMLIDAAGNVGISTPLTVSGVATFNSYVRIGANNPQLQFGGTTSAFPALRNTGNTLDVVSADTPSSVYAPLRAHHFLAPGAGNDFADLTVGPTNFTQGVTLSGGNITGSGAIYISGVTYPGRIDNGAAQTTWYLGSHGSYGLYTNTGLYIAASLWVAATTTLATTYWGAGHYAQNNVLYKPRLQAYSENWAAANVPGNGYAYLNIDASNHYYVGWDQSLTIVFQNPSPSNQVCMVTVLIFAKGANYGIGWYGGEGYGNGVRWPNGTAPAVTITNGKVDFYTFYTYDGGANWWGFVSGQNM